MYFRSNKTNCLDFLASDYLLSILEETSNELVLVTQLKILPGIKTCYLFGVPVSFPANYPWIYRFSTLGEYVLLIVVKNLLGLREADTVLRGKSKNVHSLFTIMESCKNLQTSYHKLDFKYQLSN